MITKIEKFKENFGFNIPQIQPKNKEELKDIIRQTIKNSPKGNECDLNFIDTSLIEDMSYIFFHIKNFNGDISKWDVSNVTDMYGMFQYSKFNGDISNWDVSNVSNMSAMFFKNQFNSDISKWNVSNVTDMENMFKYSKFNGDISKWNVSNVKYMKYMFDNSPLESNPPIWYKN